MKIMSILKSGIVLGLASLMFISVAMERNGYIDDRGYEAAELLAKMAIETLENKTKSLAAEARDIGHHIVSDIKTGRNQDLQCSQLEQKVEEMRFYQEQYDAFSKSILNLQQQLFATLQIVKNTGRSSNELSEGSRNAFDEYYKNVKELCRQYNIEELGAKL